MTLKIKDYWWENEDLIIVTETDEKWSLKKPYLTSINFGELEISNDQVFIENTIKWPISCEERTSDLSN